MNLIGLHDVESVSHFTPEHCLWLAVIDRALMDYIGRTACLPRVSEQDLNAFFFEEVPRPHNLAYICQELFDWPGAADKIRDRAVELAKQWKEKPKIPGKTNNYYYGIPKTRRRVN